MEYDIYDLMRGLQDDSVPLPEDGAADLHRIKELTMHKIQENQDGHGARPIRRVTRGLLVAAIAAAVWLSSAESWSQPSLGSGMCSAVPAGASIRRRR